MAINGIKCVLFGEPLRPGACLYDRNYVVDVEAPNGDTVLRPVSKLALDAMISCYEAESLAEDLAEKSLMLLGASHMSKAMVGLTYEAMILTYYRMTGAEIRWTLRAHAAPITIHIKHFQVHYTHVVKRVELSILDLSMGHLFLPASETFAGYDMFLLDGKCKLLYAVQVTVAKRVRQKVVNTNARGRAVMGAWWDLLFDAGFAFVQLWFTTRCIAIRDPRLIKKLNFVYTDDMHIPRVREQDVESVLLQGDESMQRALQASKRPRP